MVDCSLSLLQFCHIPVTITILTTDKMIKLLTTHLEPPGLEEHDAAHQVVPHLLGNVQTEATVFVI